MSTVVRRAVLAAIGSVWALSLLFPAVQLQGGPTLHGWTLLMRGWQAAGSGILAWYANPLFLIALAAAVGGAPRAAGALSGAGLVLGLTSFAAGELAAARGLPVTGLSFATGFYVWLAAQVALVTFSCWCAIAPQRQPAPEAPKLSNSAR